VNEERMANPRSSDWECARRPVVVARPCSIPGVLILGKVY